MGKGSLKKPRTSTCDQEHRVRDQALTHKDREEMTPGAPGLNSHISIGTRSPKHHSQYCDQEHRMRDQALTHKDREEMTPDAPGLRLPFQDWGSDHPGITVFDIVTRSIVRGVQHSRTRIEKR